MAMAIGGTLHVTLVSATLLPPTSAQDPADTYATLICGKQQFTTKTARDQGTLPAWNERHAFELEAHDEYESQDLVIEIFAARPELNELLGVAKLSLCKVIPPDEETSLYPLSLPHEGECGQVKIMLKWESRISSTAAPLVPKFGGFEQIQHMGPMYPSAPTQPSAHVHPQRDPVESYRGEQLYVDCNTTADAAASALAGLALNKEQQHRSESSQTHQDGSGSASNITRQHAQVQSPYAAYTPLSEKRESNPHQPPEIDTYCDSGSYPPYSSETPGHYPPQGLPYLTSPIGGVVNTGRDYGSPTPAYTHPPFEVTRKLKESESVAEEYGLPATAYPESNQHYPPSPSTYSPASIDLSPNQDREKVSDVRFETQFYSGTPISQPEGYPPSFQPHVTNTGFTSYGAPFSAASETYPPGAPSYPPSVDFSIKAQNLTRQENSAAAYGGVTSYLGGSTPESNVGYHRSSAFPSASQYDPNIPPPGGYPGQQNSGEGEDDAKLTMNASSQATSERDIQGKGLYGYQYAYPPGGYAQPYYPPAAYPQYGYPPQNLGHSYPPHGYPPQHPHQHILPGFGAPYPYQGYQVPYGVAAPYHGHYQHHGGHGGHHGVHKFGGHGGGHAYWQQGHGGHKSGHGYYGHKGGHGHGGYGYGHHAHHGGHHKHHKH